jgi:hypothetical protein
MKRTNLALVLMAAPALFIVRAVVRYQNEKAAMERTFGTDAEREARVAQVIASGQAAEDAGAATGANETEQGCLERGFEQERSGGRQYARLMHFLEGCLRTARPTPGFCDQVPIYRATMSADDEQRSTQYQAAVCQKEGFTDWQCRASVRVVQIHCHPLL